MEHLTIPLQLSCNSGRKGARFHLEKKRK